MPDPVLLALMALLGAVIGALSKYAIDRRLSSGSVRTSNAETVFTHLNSLVARVEKRLEECEADRVEQGVRLDRLARDNRELDEKVYAVSRENRLFREDLMLLRGNREDVKELQGQVRRVQETVSEALVKTTAIDDAVNNKLPGLATIAEDVVAIRDKQEADNPTGGT